MWAVWGILNLAILLLPSNTITSYVPGDIVVHVWGEAAGIQWAAGTWMVKYGCGFIPSTLRFALADCAFSTSDLYLMYQTLRIYIFFSPPSLLLTISRPFVV